jgi:transcription elongation GreA/GreB family factor
MLEKSKVLKSKVLECIIVLEKDRIDVIKKSIAEKRKDIISFQDQEGNDSLDNAKKVEYSIDLDNLRKSLSDHEEVLSRLKSMKLSSNDNISFGSLINLENMVTGDSKMYFIICVGGNDIKIDEKIVSTMSLRAPFVQSLINKKENDEVCFREVTFKVLSVQ